MEGLEVSPSEQRAEDEVGGGSRGGADDDFAAEGWGPSIGAAAAGGIPHPSEGRRGLAASQVHQKGSTEFRLDAVIEVG